MKVLKGVRLISHNSGYVRYAPQLLKNWGTSFFYDVIIHHDYVVID